MDGIYVPTDNTFASAAAVVGEVAKETKTPIVAGSVEQVEDGALATFGIDYKSLGKQTGELAAKILDGDEKPATTPVETANKLELVVPPCTRPWRTAITRRPSVSPLCTGSGPRAARAC